MEGHLQACHAAGALPMNCRVFSFSDANYGAENLDFCCSSWMWTLAQVTEPGAFRQACFLIEPEPRGVLGKCSPHHHARLCWSLALTAVGVVWAVAAQTQNFLSRAWRWTSCFFCLLAAGWSSRPMSVAPLDLPLPTNRHRGYIACASRI